MNNVNLIGRITKDLEIKMTTNGTEVCSFNIAVDAGKDKAYFIPCVAWKERAKNIAKYFHKGDKIGISGNLSQRTYEAVDGKTINVIEVMVGAFDFCNGKKENNNDDEGSGEVPFEL